MKVLVVDDALLSRVTVRNMVQAAGHDAVEATNGREALDAISSQEPELMFLDLLMPEMDGFQVLEQLRDDGSSLPVYVLSADIQKSSRDRCHELGARGFLNKPVAEEELKAILSDHA